MTCKECRFWEQKESKAPQNGVIQGICHRNPPKTTGCFVPKVNQISGEIQPQLVELTIWPVTANIGWCGEFEEEEEKEKPLKVRENLNEPIMKTPQQLDAHLRKKRMARKAG